MKSLGFNINPIESVDENQNVRKFIMLEFARGSVVAKEKSNKTLLPADVPSKLSPNFISMLKAKRVEIDQEIAAMEGAPSVSAAVREIRLHHGAQETRVGVETALTFVRNVLTTPHDLRMYRVKKNNPVFFRTLGKLHGSDLLMRSINFISAGDSNNGAVYILKSVGNSDSFDASKIIVATENDNFAGNFYFFFRCFYFSITM